MARCLQNAAAAGAALTLSTAFAEPPQVSAMVPTPPQAGATLFVRYDANAAGAALVGGMERFSVIELVTANGTQIQWGPLRPGSDGVIEGRAFTLSDDAISGTVRFYSMRRRSRAPSEGNRCVDSAATIHFVVERDGGHGILRSSSDEEIEQRIQEARSRRADDCEPFLAKWQVLANRHDRSSWTEVIRSDLADIATSGADTPDARAVMVAGHAMIGELDAALQVAERLVDAFPHEPATSRAMACIATMLERAPERSGALIRRFAEQVPSSLALRGDAGRFLATDAGASLATADAVFDAWGNEWKEDPRPRAWQALSRVHRDKELERADTQAARAIELLLTPGGRAYADPDGGKTDAFLAEWLDLRSSLAAKRGDGPAALLFALAAQGAATEHASERVAVERGWNLVAGVDAEGEPNAAPPAPSWQDIILTDLDGQSIRLADLRGRVVVLNFWFVGCTACKMEMPRLNALVERFAGRDVQFLAPSLDQAEDNRRVLAERPFLYRTLSAAMPLAKALNVAAYPTHVVIDRSGAIALVRTGSNASVEEDMAATIERLLENGA